MRKANGTDCSNLQLHLHFQLQLQLLLPFHHHHRPKGSLGLDCFWSGTAGKIVDGRSVRQAEVNAAAWK